MASIAQCKLISAILGLLCVSGVTWAQGIVHVIPPQPVNYAPVELQNEIDINQDGTADFSLISYGGRTTILAPLGNNRLIAWPEPPPDLGYLLSALPQGYSIGSSIDPVYQWYDRNTDQFGAAFVGDMVAIDNRIVVISFFAGLDSAYAGFDLYYDGASHYGWMHFSNPLPIVAGQVTDWAYETSPNQAILAGAVPEPSTWALIGLASLFVAFGARFKRK